MPDYEIRLPDASDWALFDRFASTLVERLGAVPGERLDGLDQRYWSFSVRGLRVTLHLEHYLGISLLGEGPEASLAELATDLLSGLRQG